MNEEQLNEILSSYRDAINALVERADAQDTMIKAIKEQSEYVQHIVFDEVINPAKKAMDEEIYNAGLNDFSSRYGEKLGGYNDKLRPIEGQDFDIMKQAYDGYNAIEGEKPDEAAYVDELVKAIDNQLESIRQAIGADPEAEVAVKQKDGETVVEVEGKEVSTDEPKEETVEKEEVSEEETNPEELAALEKELLAYK